MSCSPMSWGWDPGIPRWVYAHKELSTEIGEAERMWHMSSGCLPQSRSSNSSEMSLSKVGTGLFGHQCGLSQVTPWQVHQDNPGWKGWLSGSITYCNSNGAWRQAFHPCAVSRCSTHSTSLFHHLSESKTFALQNLKELCLQKFPSPPLEADFVWLIHIL